MKIYTLAKQNLSGFLATKVPKLKLVQLLDSNSALAEHEALRSGPAKTSDDWRSVTSDASNRRINVNWTEPSGIGPWNAFTLAKADE